MNRPPHSCVTTLVAPYLYPKEITLMPVISSTTVRNIGNLRTGRMESIYSWLIVNPDSSLTEVCKATNVPHESARTYLYKLQAHGLVTVRIIPKKFKIPTHYYSAVVVH